MVDAASGRSERELAQQQLGAVLPELGEYANLFAHKGINARAGLSPRERELVIVGMLMALGDTGRQLRSHADAALGAGLTVDELKEVLLQAIPYLGFPRAYAAAFALAGQLGAPGAGQAV